MNQADSRVENVMNEENDVNVNAKLNCWEFKKCGREPGGSKVSELGICSAAVETACNGINGGKNGGRYCWRVAGTFCGGKPQGSFAKKLSNCVECEFFKQVQNELSYAFKL